MLTNRTMSGQRSRGIRTASNREFGEAGRNDGLGGETDSEAFLRLVTVGLTTTTQV
jgi:hypothetical protein